jgi:hypothetical protein
MSIEYLLSLCDYAVRREPAASLVYMEWAHKGYRLPTRPKQQLWELYNSLPLPIIRKRNCSLESKSIAVTAVSIETFTLNNNFFNSLLRYGCTDKVRSYGYGSANSDVVWTFGNADNDCNKGGC